MPSGDGACATGRRCPRLGTASLRTEVRRRFWLTSRGRKRHGEARVRTLAWRHLRRAAGVAEVGDDGGDFGPAPVRSASEQRDQRLGSVAAATPRLPRPRPVDASRIRATATRCSPSDRLNRSTPPACARAASGVAGWSPTSSSTSSSRASDRSTARCPDKATARGASLRRRGDAAARRRSASPEVVRSRPRPRATDRPRRAAERTCRTRSGHG